MSPNGRPGQLKFNTGSVVRDLVDVQFTDTRAGGRVPDNFNWQYRAPVDFWLVRGDGFNSKPLEPRPQFNPEYEIRMLTWQDISDHTCTGGDFNDCNSSGGDATIYAEHRTFWGQDAGTDNFQVRGLKNGWRTFDMEFARLIRSIPTCSPLLPWPPG
jgi:hypothetical protein